MSWRRQPSTRSKRPASEAPSVSPISRHSDRNRSRRTSMRSRWRGSSRRKIRPDDAAAIADMPRSFCVSCSRPDIAAINFGNRSGRGRSGGAAADASGPREAPPSRKRICFSTQAALSSPASTAMRRAASKVLASKVRTPIDGSAGAIVTSAAPSSATSMLPESSGPRQNRNKRSASCRVSGTHDRISEGLFQTGFRGNQSR